MIKDDVLMELENNKGEYISGADLAKRLNVSRNAVWKSIKSLEKDGYIIESTPRLGYCLSNESDILSSFSIQKYVDYPLNITVYDTIQSTNTTLKAMALENAKEGTVLVSREQTAGRGRMGKKFYSPKDTGIYLSILLRPDIPAEKALFLTTMASVACAKAIEDIADVKADIKWVNDVYINNKKVSGILTESTFNVETGTLDYVIVGIGINLCPPPNGFPKDIDQIATTVFKNKKESLNLKSALVGHFLNYFFNYYNNFESENYVDEYIERSMLIGKDISIIKADQLINAKAIKIDKKCRLKVQLEDGSTKWLNSGEVSIRI